MSCMPRGRFSARDRAKGSEIAGRPARLAGTVNRSSRNEAVLDRSWRCTASSVGAHEGAVGVKRACTPLLSNAATNSSWMTRRTFCACR